jgi:hypothetical protein
MIQSEWPVIEASAVIDAADYMGLPLPVTAISLLR